jgi:hypothetical protein
MRSVIYVTLFAENCNACRGFPARCFRQSEVLLLEINLAQTSRVQAHKSFYDDWCDSRYDSHCCDYFIPFAHPTHKGSVMIRRLLMPFSLIAIGLNLGFSALPAIYVPAYAETTIGRAATLVGQDRDSQINVRSSPSTSAPIQHYGLVGDSVTVLQETADVDGYTWYFVQFPTSQATGWVRGDLVALSNSYSDNDHPIETLPDVGDIRFRAVTYEHAESSNAPELETAIARELSGDVAGVRYLYNVIDLDGDGRYEVVVYLTGSATCGTGGCTMMIFKIVGNGNYALISRHTLVNNPIVVSNTTTNGWRDLVVYVAGGGAKPSYRILKFDGSTYPSNPSTAPEVSPRTIVTGNAVIADKITPHVGLPISN